MAPRSVRIPRSTLAARALLATLALTCALEAPLGAQEEPDTVPGVCPQGRITSLFIDSHSVFDLTDPDLNERFDWAYNLANRLHVPTREGVVRTELLFGEGDCYEIERLRDSERLLRALPFIADVDIFGVRQADGGVHVIVDTQDEWSTNIGVKLGSTGPMGVSTLRLSEDNLLGTGRHVSAFSVSDEEDQAYGVSFFTPQTFGTRWDTRLDVGRTPVGRLLREELVYPFVGQVGRWAFRQSLAHDDHYFEYRVPGSEGLVAVWYPESRKSMEIGGAFRWGTRGLNHTILGGVLTGEWISYPAGPRLANEDDRAKVQVPIPLPNLAMDSVSSVRAMVMTGQRNIYYVRRRALDTVNGTEDVELGVETELALGPSIPGVSTDRDLALDFGISAGGEFLGSNIAGGRLQMQARRSYDTPPERSEWSDVFGQLHAWSYWRTSPDARQTIVTAVSAVGGWHNRVPFQLTLGGDTGMRGYADHVYAGGRRVIASVEHRAYLGWPYPQLFDLGSVAFIDAGKIWAGDAPFGVDSPIRVDVGVGLRGGFPPGSRQTWRLDLGVPIQGGAGWRDLVLSVGVGQRIGKRTAARDPQMERSTRRGLSTLFTLPGQP